MRYRWFADKERETNEFGVPVSRAEYDEALHPPKTPLYQVKEGIAIAVVAFILLYEWFAGDSAPVMFMCVAFLTFEVRPLVRLALGEKGGSAANALTGFSIAMFVGTLLWLFL